MTTRNLTSISSVRYQKQPLFFENNIHWLGGLYVYSYDEKDIRLNDLLDSLHEVAVNLIQDLFDDLQLDTSMTMVHFGIINNKSPGAMALSSEDGKEFFIGMNLGLILIMHNLLVGFVTASETMENLEEVDDSQKKPKDMSALLKNFYDVVCDDEIILELVASYLENMVAFVIAHELAHCFREHKKFLKQKNINLGLFDESELMAFFSHQENHHENSTMRAIETDADSIGALWCCQRFMQNTVLQNQASMDDVRDFISIQILSIGVLFALWDKSETLEDQFTTYPPSFLRLIDTSYLIADYFKEHMDFDYETDREKAFEDLERFAKYIGLSHQRWSHQKTFIKDNDFFASQFLNEESDRVTSVIEEINEHTTNNFMIDFTLEKLD